MKIALLVSIPFLWHGLKWSGLKSTKRTLATAKRDKSAVISEISERILKRAYAGKDELSRIDLSYRTLLSIFYSIVRFYFTRYFLLCQCWGVPVSTTFYGEMILQEITSANTQKRERIFAPLIAKNELK